MTRVTMSTATARMWQPGKKATRRSRRLFRRRLAKSSVLQKGRWQRDSIQEDIRQQRRARLDRVGSQVGDAVLRQDILVDVEVARRLRAVAAQDRVRRVGKNLRAA